MTTNPIIKDLMSFMHRCPTAWHTIEEARKKLIAGGFVELQEEEHWKIAHAGRYFVTRNGSSLCAFIVPEKSPVSACLLASHTDSPAFKLKPNAEFRKENMVMLGVEVYGAPLLTSWLNRDLAIAGRLLTMGQKNKITQTLVNFKDSPVVIPQLAIHLDREVNEKGLILNRQEHLAALAAIRDPKDKTTYLESLYHPFIGNSAVVGSELFLYPIEAPSYIGNNKELISAYRIDNLSSVHASLTALLNIKKSAKDSINMIAFWDNEEIGSATAQGAGSPFISQIIERILLSLKIDRESYFRLISKSLCVSIDVTHALHPNYIEKHEPRHQALFGKGVVLKSNAQQRYVSDASSSSHIIATSLKHKLPLQKFVNRTDIPGGSTIGPIHAALTGMKTVDIGIPQLSMHSARELMSAHDQLSLCTMLEHLLKDYS